MGRIFGKLVDPSFVRTGIIEFKNGIITRVTPATTSPFKTHRYDPKSYIIFPGFVDPLVLVEHPPAKHNHFKHGFTNIRMVPAGPLKKCGEVARLKEADGQQYVVDFNDSISDFHLCDIIKLHELFINGLKKHVTFVPEWQSSVKRFESNTTHVSRHPEASELEGIEAAMVLVEKYKLTCGMLISCYSALKRVFASFKLGYNIFPILPIRNLVEIENADDDKLPPLRDEAIRQQLLKNFFVINNAILSNFSSLADLEKFPEYVAELVKFGVSVRELANAVSLAPNRFLGIHDAGCLQPGFRADFTVLSSSGEVECYVAGELVSR